MPTRCGTLEHRVRVQARIGALSALRRPLAAAAGAERLGMDRADTLGSAGAAGAACSSCKGSEHVK